MLTAVSEQTKVMAHLNPDDPKHSLHSNTQSVKDAACTKQIIEVIKNQMIDPFRCEQKELLNISTGCIADSEDLICAREKGSEALAAVKTTGSEKVTPVRLATFATKTKKPLSMALKTKQIYEEESAVVRNLYFVQDLDAEKKVEVFSHEWTSCPSSLFEADPSLDQGYTMRKGNKADYLAAIQTALGGTWIQKDVLPSSTSNSPVVMLVDAMAFIQKYQHLGSGTFYDLQEKYLKLLLSIIPDNCNCVHFVGDRYDVSPELSLKGEERDRRSKISCSRMREYKPHDMLAIPDWKSFVHNPLNKSNLLNYMGESWTSKHTLLPAGFMLILGGVFRDPGCTVQLSVDRAFELPELSCEKHEEADTGMFAHMVYSIKHHHHRRALIVASDTDIITMSLYFITQLDDLHELWVTIYLFMQLRMPWQ